LLPSRKAKTKKTKNMEWLVPACIVPLQFLAWAAIPSYKRNTIVAEGKRGAEELRAVAVKVRLCTGTKEQHSDPDPRKVRYTRAEVTYETKTEKKLGGFVLSRKRMRASCTAEGSGCVNDLVGVKRRI
jgi:hypothetical protein